MGNTVTSDYDALYRLRESIDPLGRRTQLAYNENNELTTVTDALGGQSRQNFDADGNRISLVNTNNGQTTFVYNQAGQLISISTEAGHQVQFTYNDRGLLTGVTNGRGQQAVYEYDAAGRVTRYTDPTGTISYTYDANGNLLTVTDEKGTIIRAYDELGRVTQYTNADGQQIQYAYDEVGNLVTLTYPGGKQVNYTYDAANRLTKVEDWAGRITRYEYDKNGRLTKTTRPNQTVLTQTYNAAGQLIEQKDLDKDGKVISSYTFEYDAIGNIVSESSPYLAPGVSLTDIPNIGMTYTEDNRLATFNGQAVQFDADGNMISGPLNGQMSSYVYDSRNRLVTAGNLTYEYDAENNRVSVTESSGGTPSKTDYVVNPHAALSQVLIKTVGNEQTYYVYGLGLIGQEAAGEYSTYHFDLRGSTVALTNANGKVTDRYQYSTYGELLSSTGDTDTPFLFNGRDGVVTDANGLYYMRARYYNPEIRRFVSQDLLLGVVIDGQSLNRYAYVGGNPVGFVDPLGLARDGSIGGTVNRWLDSSTPIIKIKIPSSGELVSTFASSLTGSAFGTASRIKKSTDSFINEKGRIQFYPKGSNVKARPYKRLAKGGAVVTVVSNVLDVGNTWSEKDGNTNLKRIQKTAIQLGGAFGGVVVGLASGATAASSIIGAPETGGASLSLFVVAGSIDYGGAKLIENVQNSLYKRFDIK